MDNWGLRACSIKNMMSNTSRWRAESGKPRNLAEDDHGLAVGLNLCAKRTSTDLERQEAKVWLDLKTRASALALSSWEDREKRSTY